MKPQTLLFALIFTFIGCQNIEPSHKITTKNHAIGAFEKIRVSGAIEVDISFSPTEEVIVEAPENIHQHINVSVSSEELDLSLKSVVSINGDANIKVHIKTSDLNRVAISGASSVKLNDVYKGDKFDLDLSGASFFKGGIIVNSSSIEMSGAASAEIKGSAKNVEAEISGASDFSSHDFNIGTLDIDLSGASNAELVVKTSLSAVASGASSFEYKGNPTIVKKNASGASSIKKH